MRITGTVVSDGSVVCAGQLEGTIECDNLHILPGATLNGDIKAIKSVTIDGKRLARSKQGQCNWQNMLISMVNCAVAV